MQVQATPPGLVLALADARSWSPLPTPAALAKLAMVSLYFKFNSTARLQQFLWHQQAVALVKDSYSHSDSKNLSHAVCIHQSASCRGLL